MGHLLPEHPVVNRPLPKYNRMRHILKAFVLNSWKMPQFNHFNHEVPYEEKMKKQIKGWLMDAHLAPLFAITTLY